jgi:adenylate cyclase
MALKTLKEEIAEEVATILASDFEIEVRETSTVPHSSDASITFPNLDEKRQGTKLIDTCVLYIDIRRSTQLNLTHKPQTVSKLYSAFVRAMTRCARHHKGHVRGIIGDRVMVIFDRKDAFVNAVECAISMNSVSQFIINKHFTRGEVECGIGIDTGKMLATKTGVRRRGTEQAAYRNLVWLGRPANVASKLTDMANKPAETFQIPVVHAAFRPGILSIGLGMNWVWRDIYPGNFVRQLTIDGTTNRLKHSDPTFEHMLVQEETYVRSPKTAPILMTEAVWDGYKAAAPTSACVTKPMFHPIELAVPAYKGKVYAGDVHYPVFKE